MHWIVMHINWVLIVCGVLTTSMIFPMIAPRRAAKALFGEAAEGSLVALFARSWGQMISSIGLLLIYVAFNEAARMPVLVFAAVTKFTFVTLVIANGKLYARKLAMQIAVGDLIMVVLFVWYMVAAAQAI
jgi:hypothetical protein